MDALEFLEPKKQESTANMGAEKFLGEAQPFEGGKPQGGVGRDIPHQEWWHGPVEWLSAEHIKFRDTLPRPEVERDPKTGEVITNEPESGEVPFLEDPISLATIGLVSGGVRPATTLAKKAARGAREAIGWLTGGASEVPALTKAGVKAVPKVVRGVEAKQLEKTMARATTKPFGQVPERIAVKTVPSSVGAAPVRAIESKFLEGEFAERFLMGEVKKPSKIPTPKRPEQLSDVSPLPKAKPVTPEPRQLKYDTEINPKEPWEMSGEEYYGSQKRPTPFPGKKAEQYRELELADWGERVGERFPTFGMTDKEVSQWASNIRTSSTLEYNKTLTNYEKTGKTGKESFMGVRVKSPEEALAEAKETLDRSVKTAERIKLQHKKDKAQLYVDGKGWMNPDIIKKHKSLVQQAIKEGKPVPQKVLAEYPDLISTPTKKLKPKPGETVKKGDVELYSGIPIHKAGEAWVKRVGEPVWDNLVEKQIPKLLEKIPGGKSINRALIYEYRGNLPDTAKYIHSMEDLKKGQAIGREYAIDLGKRLQSVPEESQLRMGEYIRGEISELTGKEKVLADEAKNAMLDLGRQAVDVGLLSEKTFFKNAGRYMPRLYTSKEYQSLLTQFNLKKANRLDLSRFKRRKDVPKEIREEMGEILTPGYPIAKGVTQLTHDIETARFFNGIAATPEWAKVKQIKLTKAGKPSTYKQTTYHPLTGEPIEHMGVRKEFVEPIPEGWKQLPPNPKLGKLSESYVHPEIFDDLEETIRVMKISEKVWRKALGAWKFGKVIVSPKTHIRNTFSNSVLAHLGGLPMYEQPIYLTKAAKALKQKNKYWQEVKKIGGVEHTWTTGELSALFDQVEGQMGGIKASSIPERLGIIGEGWNIAKKGMRKAADLYQAEEQWFKMAKYIHNVERKKMTSVEAWKDAEKWLFNYAKVTKFQDKYRTKWYGAPFATFTFKALPRIAEAMVKTPWRFALPGAMIYGLEKAAQRKIGDTKEEIAAKKALRPEWQKGSFLGIPNFARVPFIDETGREYFLNLTYVLPWGDIGEAGNFGPIPGGLMPMSQPFVKEPMQQFMNYDNFWEEPIFKEEELAGKTKTAQRKTKAIKRGKHIAQTMLPTPFIDATKIFDAIKQRPDYKGRIRPPKIAAFDVIAGIKMYPVDYVERVARQIGKIDPQSGYLARKLHRNLRTLAIKKKAYEDKGKDTALYDKQIEEITKQLSGLAEESKELGETYEVIKEQK